MSGTAPVEELAAFLQARGAQYLSGKEADVDVYKRQQYDKLFIAEQ